MRWWSMAHRSAKRMAWARMAVIGRRRNERERDIRPAEDRLAAGARGRVRRHGAVARDVRGHRRLHRKTTLHHAMDLGVLIDTSDAYGHDYHNERIIGEVARSRRAPRGRRGVIATKFG